MKKRKIKPKPILILLILIISITFILYPKNKQSDDSIELKYNTIDVNIDNFYIYGRNLNIEGTFTSDIDINELYLTINNKDYPLNFDIDNNQVSFETSNKENYILLDNIEIGNYYVVLKIITNEEKNYLIKTNYQDDIEYFTITNDNKNNKINIKVNNNIKLEIENTNLPNEYYDLVIDPGHGEDETGEGSYGEYLEKDWNLKIALLVRDKLEAAGYKVKMTREDDTVPNGNENDPYGAGGRVVMPFEVKAKYLFSIHLNNCGSNCTTNGVEVYMPGIANIDFAKILAKSIVENAHTHYSTNQFSKVANGVYIRYHGDYEINEMVELAKERDHEVYPITYDTPYYWILREPGGKITGAYRDGRDGKAYNLYYNSNVGVESYLLELGYMPNIIDRNNIINNYEKYAEGISKGIIEYLENY